MKYKEGQKIPAMPFQRHRKQQEQWRDAKRKK